MYVLILTKEELYTLIKGSVVLSDYGEMGTRTLTYKLKEKYNEIGSLKEIEDICQAYMQGDIELEENYADFVRAIADSGIKEDPPTKTQRIVDFIKGWF